MIVIWLVVWNKSIRPPKDGPTRIDENNDAVNVWQDFFSWCVSKGIKESDLVVAWKAHYQHLLPASFTISMLFILPSVEPVYQLIHLQTTLNKYEEN